MKISYLVRLLFSFCSAKEIRELIVLSFIRQTGTGAAGPDHAGTSAGGQKIGIGPVEKRGPDGPAWVDQPLHGHVRKQQNALLHARLSTLSQRGIHAQAGRYNKAVIKKRAPDRKVYVATQIQRGAIRGQQVSIIKRGIQVNAVLIASKQVAEKFVDLIAEHRK